MGRKVKGKELSKGSHTKDDNFSRTKKKINNVELSRGFEELQGLANSINNDFTLRDDEKAELNRLIEIKREELSSPENIRKRGELINKALAESAIRRKKEKELDDKIRSEFLQLINNADTKNKLSRLRNKIDRDPKINFKIKFELQEIIRKKRRKLK